MENRLYQFDYLHYHKFPKKIYHKQKKLRDKTFITERQIVKIFIKLEKMIKF